MTASRPAANRPVIDLDAGHNHQYGYRNPLDLDGPEFSAVKASDSDTADIRELADATRGTR